jgi:hypothetical protein
LLLYPHGGQVPLSQPTVMSSLRDIPTPLDTAKPVLVFARPQYRFAGDSSFVGMTILLGIGPRFCIEIHPFNASNETYEPTVTRLQTGGVELVVTAS